MNKLSQNQGQQDSIPGMSFGFKISEHFKTSGKFSIL